MKGKKIRIWLFFIVFYDFVCVVVFVKLSEILIGEEHQVYRDVVTDFVVYTIYDGRSV